MKKAKTIATLLQIAQLGNPLVRKRAQKVTVPIDEKIKELILNMKATCKDAIGVGIAAPQVYQSLRIFIIASHPSPRYPNAPTMKPMVLINPKLISYSKKKIKDWEGCLSIPGIRGFVPRYEQISVEYLTEEGKLVKKIFTGFLARIFQHEYDHIEGKVFLDRVENTKELMSEKEFQKMIRA